MTKTNGDEQTPTDDDTDAVSTQTTNELIHKLAIGLTKVSMGLEKAAQETLAAAEHAKERAEPAIEKGKAVAHEARDRAEPALTRGKELADEARKQAGPAMERGKELAADALEASGRAAKKAAAGARKARAAGTEAAHATGTALGRARDISVGLVLRAEESAEQAAENLEEMAADLRNRARAARAAGLDFYDQHREEILALIITAAKVAAVIGIRRLSRPSDKGTGRRGRRLVDAASILTAVVGQIGELLARNPNALPLLKEMYAKGEPSEQAVVGMLLGPALGSDPEHAAEVVREFLEDASSDAAADTIARRTLTPLLRENPELEARLLPWVDAASKYVQRAALIALTRHMEDRHSRLGDIVAAGVVVLEDHNEEVREAVRWLLAAASEVDVDAAARAVRDRLAQLSPDARREAEDALEDLPERLRARIDALEDPDDE